jgi:hypothetical protein
MTLKSAAVSDEFSKKGESLEDLNLEFIFLLVYLTYIGKKEKV